MSEKARTFPEGSQFVVVAEIDKGAPWRSVLTTKDWDFADATAKQFREADVKVRIDGIFPRRDRVKARSNRGIEVTRGGPAGD